MRYALTALLLVACADDSGGGGPDTTSHVETLLVTPGNPGCFKGNPFDADTTTPGPQYDCSVTKTTGSGVFPQCDNLMTPTSSTNQPCWNIGINASCTSMFHYELRIAPSVTEGVTAQCLVQ
jgi:hypothetical protein